jgi:hypothetical protein
MSTNVSSGEKLVLQRSALRVGAVNDPLEREADAMADRVMRMPSPEVGLIQRCPGGCPDEEMLRRQPIDEEEEEEKEVVQLQPLEAPSKKGGSYPWGISPQIEGAIRARRGGGSPLPGPARNFFEPRFGVDLRNVRIHNDLTAASLARSVNARAFTLGRDIFFGADEWAPGLDRSDRLIAHELAHTIQPSGGMHQADEPVDLDGVGHRGAANYMRRTVAANSTCAANVHNAPADPLGRLRVVDQLAQDMALGASHVLSLEALTFADPTFGPSYVSTAYRRWFGPPTRTTTGRFRSRFRTATFAAENEAMRHEMTVLSDRFRRIHGWLAGNVRYRCPGTASITIGTCASPCGTKAAMTCDDGTRAVAVCPEFWNEPDPQDRSQAALLIHEAIHPLFHFRPHSTVDPARRGRNPGCYQGFVLEIFQTGLVPADCKPL